MRPLKLIMSAFGSYAGEETIDFSQMEQGIFLVTGDTGSGKTTIFDGIVYALYDRTSGGVRDGNMMRSAYADLRTPTFVELEFLCRGEVYRIIRNPDYERESLRKDKDGNSKKTQEKSKAEFYLPDGSMFRGNKREINLKIEELLGMDARQFMQMAMIAQGDFLKLLHAKSEERKEIFSKIFDTGIYGKVQEELRKKEKESAVALKNKERACLEQMSRILYPKEFLHSEELKACKDAQHLGNAIRLLRELQEEDQKKARELGEKRELLGESLVKLEKRKDLLEKLSSVRETRKQKKEWLEENLPNEKVYLEREQILEEQLRVQEEEGVRLKQTLEKELEELSKKQDTMAVRMEEMEGLKRLWEQAIRCLKQQKEYADKWNVANESYKEKRETYERFYEAFFREQAGILAQNLKESDPCPVCGSTVHPKKAALSASAPDQNQVNQAKKTARQAEEEREEMQLLYQKAAQVYQSALGSLNQEGVRLLGESFDAGEQLWREEANKAMQQAKVQLENCRREFQIRKEQGETQEQALTKKITQSRMLYQKARAEKEQFIRFAERTRGEEYAAAEQETELLSEWEVYTGIKQSLDNEELIEQLHSIRVEQEQKREESNLTERLWQECHVREQTNAVTQRLLKAYEKEYEELKEQYVLIHHLKLTADGGLSGSAKLDFESYIQRKYFERIIARANQRLLQMSSGQFLLKCKEIDQLSNRTKAGLDLDVYSLVTESVRDVKTLSGGESFMAALSMALGLADVVQDTAGAIRLDTMFIDEGFGSLDDHSREQAIRVLYELAGEKRLIGIISHVTELKEQIEAKLVVCKGKQGSHVRWQKER